jgi:hypothetical protein
LEQSRIASATRATGLTVGCSDSLLFDGALAPLRAAESRSVLDERALVCGRHIFGWYFRSVSLNSGTRAREAGN